MERLRKIPTKTANPDIPYIPLSPEELNIAGVMEITDKYEERFVSAIGFMLALGAVLSLHALSNVIVGVLVLLALLFLFFGQWIQNERLKYEKYLEAIHKYRKSRPLAVSESSSIINAVEQALRDGDLN